MENNKKRKLTMILSIIFVGLVLIGNVYALIEIAMSNEFDATEKIGRVIVSSFAIIALLSAIVYISSGFNKSSANYFKLFLYTFILSILVMLFYEIVIIKAPFISISLAFVTFVLLNILLGTRDLGKKVSLTLSIVVFVFVLFSLADYFISKQFSLQTFFLVLTDISLSIILIGMILLKYYDKSSRKEKKIK